ncbi:MAG: ankyrin repeat domain-containing protein [Planctomycetaceae bacterium]|nr:ankyrin repeat domain-containing protein [Planctomycetaceae bacterium]
MDIHAFASRGDISGVRNELAKGVSIELRDDKNHTPLACAASSADTDAPMLELLIDAGADVNALVGESEGFLLGLAAGSGSVEKTQTLLDAGADIKFKSPKGYTVLINIMYALHNDERLVPLAEFLIQHGAETDCETDYSESPLSVASLMGRFDAVKVLLDAGADPSPLCWTELMKAVALGGSSDVQRLLEGGGNLDDRDRWERTPWLLSAFVEDVTKAQLLLAAGAAIEDQDRMGDTVLMHCSTRGKIERLACLIESGAKIDAINGFGKTALMCAAEAGKAECVRLLLKAGANPGHKNEYDENVMSVATTEEVVRLLMEAGEDIGDISTEMKRKLVGLEDGETLKVTKAEYRTGKLPRFGRSNPEVMDIPFWKEMVRAGITAYRGKAQFGDESDMSEPAWCFSRFGMSFTELPDGRFIQIGGEHEDFYDPDFCIYNDVIVHNRSGEFKIMGYPKDVFPPTDFHSATYIDGFIYIIGGLGYHGERQFGRTPIFRLNCESWKIEAITSVGDNPGWIYDHKARLKEPGVIAISEGKVCREIDGQEQHVENTAKFIFDLTRRRWTRT